jgi:D-amino-acid oxidase
MEIIVIGAGVSGLTTGLTLARAGHRVQIWAREVSPNTTSNVAGAVWLPFLAEPADKVAVWGKVTYDRFMDLSADPATGILVAPMQEFLPDKAPDPPWAGGVANFARLAHTDMPEGYATGYTFTTQVVDMAIYLDYLQATFQRAGGVIAQRAVNDLADAYAAAPVVVNCAGLGSRELVNDRDIHPVRGQVVRIRKRDVRRVVSVEGGPHGLAYVMPRIHDIVLGGVAEDGNDSLAADDATTASIIRRCRIVVPELGAITPEDILSIAVGLRPARSVVRVERETLAPDRWLLHNYGHGGAGVTLSWGCAEAIGRLADAIVAGR